MLLVFPCFPPFLIELYISFYIKVNRAGFLKLLYVEM